MCEACNDILVQIADAIRRNDDFSYRHLNELLAEYQRGHRDDQKSLDDYKEQLREGWRTENEKSI